MIMSDFGRILFAGRRELAALLAAVGVFAAVRADDVYLLARCMDCLWRRKT